MPSSLNGLHRVFQPLNRALDHPHPSRRECCKLPGADWLLIGILRTLASATSGRGWIQHLRNLPIALYSRVSDPLLTTCHALNEFDLYAADGHYQSSAAHDQTKGRRSAKLPSGQFMRLNLRTHAMGYLCGADLPRASPGPAAGRAR